MTSPNQEAISCWDGILFDKFSRYRHLLSGGLVHHGTAVLARHPPRPGERVVDLGCGFGDTTLVLSGAVGEGGQATGIDCSARFVEAARADGAAAGARATFRVADVQCDPLGGPYDLAFSRFGMMFFQSPVAALRNIAASLAPGGRLAFCCWRKREDNPFIHEAETRVRAIVELPPDPQGPTCGPGPFSMASADVVSSQLLAAGFERATFERSEAAICIGRDLAEAVEFGMALGPAGEVMRLAGEVAERKRPEVMASLREVFTPYVRPDGVWAPSSAWIVSAIRR